MTAEKTRSQDLTEAEVRMRLASCTDEDTVDARLTTGGFDYFGFTLK
jgi:hypothetical protein